MLRKESSSVLPEKRAIDDQVHRGYLFYLQTAGLHRVALARLSITRLCLSNEF